jgi:hypothetical protein
MKEMFWSLLFKIYTEAKGVKKDSVTFYFKKEKLEPLSMLRYYYIVPDDVIDCVHSEYQPVEAPMHPTMVKRDPDMTIPLPKIPGDEEIGLVNLRFRDEVRESPQCDCARLFLIFLTKLLLPPFPS